MRFIKQFLLVSMAALALWFSGCVKKDFDTPPINELPVGVVYTIAELRQMYADSGAFLFDFDASVYGTVISDEGSGNFYREAYMEDETDAVNLRLDNPGGLRLGDSIRIYLKGVLLNEYNNLFQLDQVNNDSNIVILANQQYIEPEVVTIEQLNTGAYQSRLIQLNDVQFSNLDLGLTWAPKDDYGNRTLVDCDENSVLVRTSNYANFAPLTIPDGKGSIIAIAGIYGTTVQLYLRTITEVDMNGSRCDGSGGGSLKPNTTITDLKAMYSGDRVQIMDTVVIEGTVTATDESGNFYKTLVIQDDFGGIELKINDYDLYSTFPVGQKIYVNCQMLYLDSYADVIQLGSVYEEDGEEKFGGIQSEDLGYHVEKVSGGIPVQPTVISINEMSREKIGMLVQLNGVEFASSELGMTYAESSSSGNRTLVDCDLNSTIVRTSNYADFATETLAEGNGQFVGILSAYYDSYQLYIRSLSDLNLTGERCDQSGGEVIPPVDFVDEDFSGVEDFENVNLPGWTNLLKSGNRLWQGKSFDGDKYVQATGYNSDLDDMETWLITPPVINTSGDKVLTFMNAQAFWAHGSNDPMVVLASTDYDGSNFETATWTELSGNMAGSSDDNYAWVESGEIDLSSFTGNVCIAFKYHGSDTESTSIQIDNVVIKGESGGNDGVTSIDEDFEDHEDFDPINIPGWLNVAVEGGRTWQAKQFDNNVYAQATAYNSGEVNETWMITPKINLDGMDNPIFEFDNAQAYWDHDGLTVLISTDFNGSDVTGATWSELDANLAGSSTPDHEWVFSGKIDISGYSGQAYIGFRYIGEDGSEDTSYRIDNVKLYDE